MTEQHPRKLLDQVRDAIRLKHYSIRTEEACVGWITRFILFHDQRHPNDMGRTEIEAFLTHLAAEQNVAASTQNQAFKDSGGAVSLAGYVVPCVRFNYFVRQSYRVCGS